LIHELIVLRKLLMAAAIGAFAVLAPVVASAAPHAGDIAPAFSLSKPTGGTLSLSQYRGKPTYLNFFASWCGPCNNEAATVAQLYGKYHRRGLATIGVNEQEDKTKALDFAHKYKWPFAIGLDDGTMGKDYGAFGLPVHVFIDKAGKVSTYRIGEMERAELEDAIKKIL
jgi:cytochrome c biogenesis protein CcmG/thiol:disulfide interchange protein DsbE